MAASALAPQGEFPGTMGAAPPIAATEVVDNVEPKKGLQAVHAQGAIFPFMQTQNVHTATIEWNTGMQQGTILYTKPVHPGMNAWGYQISPMFNAWAGGMDFSLKINATYIHAGQILMCVIPPNEDPYSLTPTSATMWPYLTIDARSMEIISTTIVDQKPTTYHYMGQEVVPVKGAGVMDGTAYFNSLAIGAQIVVMVFSRLNIGSGGSQQVEIPMWTKFAADFVFLQPRPPKITGLPVQVIMPLTCVDIPKQRTWSGNALIANIVIKPSTQLTIPGGATFTCAMRNGKWIHEVKEFVVDPVQYDETGVKSYADQTATSVQLTGSQYYAEGTFGPAGSGVPTYKSSYTSNGLFKISDSAWSSVTIAGRGMTTWVSSASTDKYVPCDIPDIALVMPESLVVFTPAAATSTGVYGIQTAEFRQQFRLGAYQSVPDNSCVFMQVYNKVLQEPVAVVKLWPMGYMTTVASATEVVLKAQDLEFRFLQIAPTTTPLVPKPAEEKGRSLHMMSSYLQDMRTMSDLQEQINHLELLIEEHAETAVETAMSQLTQCETFPHQSTSEKARPFWKK